MGLFFNEVTVGKLENTVVEVIGWGLTTRAFVRNCEADVALLEEAWHKDVAPLLLEESILLHFLAALSTLLLGLTHADKGWTTTVQTVTIGHCT